MTSSPNEEPAALDPDWMRVFETELAHDDRVERRLLVRELAIVLGLCLVVVAWSILI
ncbi:MAG TPA: hypothetical protein VN706_24440 [Gemmatimonadaceae bacterium]|nr:hypothetical protein [Gemmatimonadaceae bacterium]